MAGDNWASKGRHRPTSQKPDWETITRRMGALGLAMGAMLVLSLNLANHETARTNPIVAASAVVPQPSSIARTLAPGQSATPRPSGSLPSRRPPTVRPSPTVSRTVQLTPSLVGAWSFEEGDGPKANDSSGYGHSVALANGATWGAGSAGKGLEFDGQDDFAAAMPVVLTDSGFTISAWVRLDSDSRRAVAIAQEGEVASGFYLMYDTSGRWLMRMKSADDNESNYVAATADSLPKLGEWTHLAGVYDPVIKQLRIYVNGILAGSASHQDSWRAGGQFLIGRCKSYGRATYFWTGGLDEVRVYNRAFTDREVNEVVYHSLPAGT